MTPPAVAAILGRSELTEITHSIAPGDSATISRYVELELMIIARVKFLGFCSLLLIAGFQAGCSLTELDRFYLAPDAAASPDAPCGGIDQPCCGGGQQCQEFLSCVSRDGANHCTPCVSDIATGGSHACAITVSGDLWCWGSNNNGQLGVAGPSASTLPIRVPGVSNVRSVVLGLTHTCALTQGSDLLCWGSNESGQLGGGSPNGGPDPVRVSMVSPFGHVSAGFSFTCATTLDRRNWCWGKNDRGQLGADPSAFPTSMTPIPVANGTLVSAGGAHACVIALDSSLVCWGSNVFGQLGRTTSAAFDPMGGRVDNLLAVTNVSTGEQHTCARTGDGGVWCFGDNSAGQLAAPPTSFATSTTPVRIPLIPAASEIAVGTIHSCALTASGLLCWGSDKHGQLGDGLQVDRYMPRTVGSLVSPVDVRAGVFETCARDSDARNYCWGSNALGQIGTGSTMADVSSPDLIRFMCQ